MYFRCVLWVTLFILGTTADGEVDDLVKKIQNMQSRLNYLKTRQSQEPLKQDLMRQVRDLTQQVRSRDHHIQQTLAQLEERYSREADQQLSDKQQQVTGIAFSAYISTEGQLEILNRDVVPFNRTKTNSGSHFDLASHKFVSPRDAVYYFSVCLNNGQLGGSTSLVSDISLMMDGEEVTTIDSYNSNADGAFNINEQACAVVILPCENGSEVWVEGTGGTGGRSPIVGTEEGVPRSVFAGFLIYTL